MTAKRPSPAPNTLQNSYNYTRCTLCVSFTVSPRKSAVLIGKGVPKMCHWGVEVLSALDRMGEVPHGALPGYRHVAITPPGLAGQKQIPRSRPQVLIVLTSRSPGLRRQRFPDVGQQLRGGLVKTDHRPFGIIGLGVEVQHVFHSRHKFAVHSRDAPLLLPPRLECVFSAPVSPSRGTETPPVPVPPPFPPAAATSSGSGPRMPDCKLGLSDGPRLGHPASGADGPGYGA